jgi:hypothetical protein
MWTEVEAERALHVAQPKTAQYYSRHREKQSKLRPLKLGTTVHSQRILFRKKAFSWGRNMRGSLITLDIRPSWMD